MNARSERPELGEVLGAVLDSIASGARAHDPLSGDGIVIEEAIVELPLEGYLVVEGGEPVLRTGLPQTSMQTGFTTPVHRGRLHVVLTELPSHE
jgi:hypothetical protein